MSSPRSSNDVTSSPRDNANILLDLEAFKNIVESQTTSLKETLETMDSKLDALNQRISNVENSAKSFGKGLIDQVKLQNIAFAIDHSHIGCFGYHVCYNKNSEYQYRSSRDLATEILLNFRQGKSFELPPATISDWATCWCNNLPKEEELEEDKKLFRSKLVDQIHILTGTKPTVEFDPDRENYVISFP